MKRIDCRDLVSKIAQIIDERVKAESVVQIGEVRAIRDAKRTREPARLWLIDDDESIRRALIRIFADDNYQIFSAANANEIDQVLSGGAPNLILLDIGLPWINGFELAELMKSHRDLAQVPIVFISGQNSMPIIKKGFQVGAHDFITKPFDIEAVKKTVKTLLALNS